jgi:DNA-binding transcriptional LysR family regulator
LFTRTGGKLKPTPEADILAEHIERLMHQIALIETLPLESSPLRITTLRIATLATFGVSLLPTVINEFSRKHPALRIQLDVVDGEKIHSMVAQGLYDFGFVHYPKDQAHVSTQILLTRSVVCLIPNQHPLADRKTIRPADLDGVQIISYPGSLNLGAVIAKSLADEGIDFNLAISTNHSHVARKFVELGSHVGLVDPFSVAFSQGNETFKVATFEPVIPIAFGVIRPHHRELSQAAEAFIGYFREVAVSQIRNFID